MTPPLLSPGTLQVVIMVITCGARDDKVGIMTTVDFMYYTHSPVNIRITIAMHCHLSLILKVNLFRVTVLYMSASSGERQCITLGQSL